jgi:hypothetical protein
MTLLSRVGKMKPARWGIALLLALSLALPAHGFIETSISYPPGSGTATQGPAGPAGPAGADGAQGIQGNQGPAGNDGAPGTPGAKGDKGDKGDTGNTGSTGGNGAQGIQGIQGPPGNNGAPGADGAQGQQGIQGVQGDVGPQGPSGGLGYTIAVMALTSSPADGATVYFGTLPKAPATSANISKVYIRKAGTIKIVEIYCYSGTAGTNESWSLYVRKNNTTDTLIATLGVSASERVFSNTALSIAVAVGDYIEIKGVQPTWGTNPLTTIYGGYLYVE